MDELGYDDMDAFEATLGGTFEDWLKRLGVVEFKEENGLLMRIKEENLERKGFTIIFPIRERADLQVVCLKAPGAIVSIPELEFQMGNEDKKVVDTIFNHIGNAIFTLDLYASQSAQDQKQQILDTVDQLRRCLDLDFEWTFMLEDQTGRSEIKASKEKFQQIFFEQKEDERQDA
eukprot:TRINITY_DN3902_c0_g1_i5.p1 TRINITY_DN3902_c0_g1~~TRINITY_DN3902_c0_g1_i5.p1  ORF type:complete len:175 (-),score=44.37 TRINITY_DN3902_c0_g1_i5:127-651(-)